MDSLTSPHRQRIGMYVSAPQENITSTVMIGRLTVTPVILVSHWITVVDHCKLNKQATSNNNIHTKTARQEIYQHQDRQNAI